MHLFKYDTQSFLNQIQFLQSNQIIPYLKYKIEQFDWADSN